MARAKWYVGLRDNTRTAFTSEATPTPDSCPYVAVVGPFKTKRGATWYVRHPQSPLVTVAEIEHAALPVYAYEVQGHYGVHGYEMVTCEDTRAEGLRALREYRENEPTTSFRLRYVRQLED